MNNFKFIVLALISFLFVACNNEEDKFSVQENEIRLTSEITPSRVTSLNCQSTQIIEGQEVGVTITGGNSTHKNIAWRAGTSGTLSNTGETLYWGKRDIIITAYHPYNSNWSDSIQSFSVNSDQSIETNYLNSDLLWTTKTASKTANPVPLTFSHKLAKINVILKSDDIDDLSNAIISVCGTNITTNFNPFTGVLSSATANIQDIKAGVTTSEDSTASCIIIPQTIASGTKLITIKHNGKTYHYTLNADKEFVSGHSYSYTLNVKETMVEVDLESDKIIDWNDEEINGDMEEKIETLLLPDGWTFNQIVGNYLTNNTNLTKIKFIADSDITSDDILVIDEDGTVGYLVDNEECLEIHTNAVEFIANSSCYHMFASSDNYSFKRITIIDFSEKFNTSNVQTFSFMFNDCTSLTALDVSNFNTTNVFDMSCMFQSCYSLTSLDVSGFETSNVTNFSGMFYMCENVESLDVSKFNTSKATNMYQMFAGCKKLSTLDVLSFDTSNVTNFYGMFLSCENLTSLDVSKFDTSKATTLASMFWGCHKLRVLDVSKFDTSNVTEIFQMFAGCHNLTSLDVSGFNISNVIDMGSMFDGCSKLTFLDVSKFNTTNVINMWQLFSGCENLNMLNLSSFDTSKVLYMQNMFSGCSKLASLNLDNFDTSNVIDMSCMFNGCSNLISLDISNFNTSNVTNMTSMFSGCENLTNLNLFMFSFDKYPKVNNMFYAVKCEIKVTEESYIYLTQITTDCGINDQDSSIIFMDADGNKYVYKEDNRIFNAETAAIKPEKDENNYYLIESAANLKWFMDNCKSTPEEDYRSASYKLTTDIIFSNGTSWNPVYFNGYFDGGNHTIVNLRPKGYDLGLYAFFASVNGTIKNLIFKYPEINQTGDNDYYGVISGVLAAEASGTIINCGVIGGDITVSGSSRARATGGGLIGEIIGENTIIKGCYVVETRISGEVNSRNGIRIGGLIGSIGETMGSSVENVSILSCYTNNLNVYGIEGSDVGTFIGSTYYCNTYSVPSYITTCYYDDFCKAIGETHTTYNITIDNFDALTKLNFTQAIAKMNANLKDCDYIFDEDGMFLYRQ